MKTACAVQCPQCPFRPTALPSYLGDYTAESITSALWRNTPFYCHTKINYSNPGWEKVARAKGKLCLGSMVFAGKLGASLARLEDDHDPDVIEAREANQNRKDVECMSPTEFIAHHNPAKAALTMKKLVKKSPKKVTKLKPLPKLKGRPTDDDIDVEVARLKELRPLIRPTSAFGDDNIRSLDDQIWVLEERASENECYDRFDLLTEDQEPDEGDRDIANESEGRGMERASNATEVVRWLNGECPYRPSSNWMGLIQ